MLGWEIFKKSITQIFYNFADAIKLTGLLWLALQGSAIILAYFMIGKFSLNQYDYDGTGDIPENFGAYFLAIAIILILYSIVAPWIAVLWHRFMLLNEQSNSNIPSWKGGLIWKYLLKSIKVTLILFLIIVPLGLIAGVIAGMSGSLAFFELYGTFFFILIATYFFLRIGLVLPAVALGGNMTIKESWKKTKTVNGGIFIASILLTIFSSIMQFYAFFPNANILQNQFIMPILDFFTGWIGLMLGISILTTLYGHLVDGREL